MFCFLDTFQSALPIVFLQAMKTLQNFKNVENISFYLPVFYLIWTPQLFRVVDRYFYSRGLNFSFLLLVTPTGPICHYPASEREAFKKCKMLTDVDIDVLSITITEWIKLCSKLNITFMYKINKYDLLL